MIRRNSDSAEMSQLVPLPDGRQVEVRRLRYTWRPVDNTTLRWDPPPSPRYTAPLGGGVSAVSAPTVASEPGRPDTLRRVLIIIMSGQMSFVLSLSIALLSGWGESLIVNPFIQKIRAKFMKKSVLSVSHMCPLRRRPCVTVSCDRFRQSGHGDPSEAEAHGGARPERAPGSARLRRLSAGTLLGVLSGTERQRHREMAAAVPTAARRRTQL